MLCLQKARAPLGRLRHINATLQSWLTGLLPQDTDTSQLDAVAGNVDAEQPTSARKPPRSRAAGEQASADDASAAAQRQRRGTRRQGGGGTTSAAAAAENLQPAGQPVAFRPKASKFTADSDTIMEAVVKVSLADTTMSCCMLLVAVHVSLAVVWHRFRQLAQTLSTCSSLIFPS